MPEAVNICGLARPCNFREAVHRKLGCPPESYAETVFWRCLYPQAYWLAKIIRPLRPRYFYPDFELLDLIADSTSPSQLSYLVNIHRSTTPPKRLLGRRLRVRLSTRRVIQLAREVFVEQAAQG